MRPIRREYRRQRIPRGIVNLRGPGQSSRIAKDVIRYARDRFPPAIITHAVWLYYRFTPRREINFDAD